MILDITQKLITYYHTKDNEINQEHIDVADDRIKRFVNPNKRDEFYNAYIDKFSIFPNASRIYKILDENKHLKMKTDYIHTDSQKTPKWNDISLFPDNELWCGDNCILCFSSKEANRISCIIIENEKTQLCACAGGNPELELKMEWIAENSHRRQENKPFIDYNHFYKGRKR